MMRRRAVKKLLTHSPDGATVAHVRPSRDARRGGPARSSDADDRRREPPGGTGPHPRPSTAHRLQLSHRQPRPQRLPARRYRTTPGRPPVTVLPLSAAYECLGRWVFGRVVCDTWLVVDVLYCTASIWNLCVIAADRFTATMFPIWYRGSHLVPRHRVVSDLVPGAPVGQPCRRLRGRGVGGSDRRVRSSDDRLDRSTELRLEERHLDVPVRTFPDARFVRSLWPPCVADAEIILLPCGFFLSSIFFFLFIA